MPVTVVQEHDGYLLASPFWRWASTIDSAQVEDPVLLVCASELRRLSWWSRAMVLALVLLSIWAVYLEKVQS